LTKLPVGKTALREGVVLHPLFECIKSNGQRLIAKHKSDNFCGGKDKERQNTPGVDDPEKLKLFTEAQAIADEFVTEGRLNHILQKLPQDIGMEGIPKIMAAMIEDVEREGKGEIMESKEARKAIGAKTVKLFKARLVNKLKESQV
jgi:hypothetical protein